jgi:hypothetical protein
MSAAARRTAQDHFCSTTIIARYEMYYRQVLGEAKQTT